jgi:hypothetical protein
MHPAYKNRLDNLNHSLEGLLASMGRHTHQQLNAKPAPAAWSAMQVAQHLIAAERLSVWYVKKKTTNPHALERAGLGTWAREQLLGITLSSPIKFKAPALVSEEKFPQETALEKVTADWVQARKELAELLEMAPRDWQRRLVYRHAVAGRLTLVGMLEFFEQHFKRHQRQIERTLTKV